MHMRTMRNLCLLCLLLVAAPLLAGVTATYTAEPSLHFQQGFSPLNTSKLVAHLGTITISTTENQLFDPNLVNVNLSTTFQFSGPLTWYNDWNTNLPVYETQTTNFVLYAVSDVRGVVQVNALNQGDGSQPLRTESGNLSVKFFTAELYLVSEQDWVHYKPGANYTWVSGTMNGFLLGVAKNGSGYWDGNDILVSVNGGQPGETTLLLAGGSTTPQPVPYGEPVSEVSYLLTIIDEQSFSIANAYGAQSVRVARAQLTLANTLPNTNYGVSVVFSNTTNTSNFSLHLDGLEGTYAIPYTLLFNANPVRGGIPETWTNLSEGTYTKDILVTNIDATKAEMAPAGLYSDTITVNITPNDTI